MPHVDLARVPEYYHRYISHVINEELNTAFKDHLTDLSSLLQSIPENKWTYRYAEGKWSVKELVQHIIDAERIFAYRALCFARKDETPLPGFDENSYADNSGADKRSSSELMEELRTVQRSTAQMFASFDGEQLDHTGSANGKSVYVKAIGYILIGHSLHHKKILQERYLS
jgi:hypothetical protein